MILGSNYTKNNSIDVLGRGEYKVLAQRELVIQSKYKNCIKLILHNQLKKLCYHYTTMVMIVIYLLMVFKN